MKKVMIPCLFVVAGLLAGCASTTVYPLGNGKYSLVSTSSQEGYAEKYAEKKAAKVCAKKGKKLVVIKHKTVYQGINKKDAALLGFASDVLSVAGGTAAGNPSDKSNNYKTTLTFSCR